MTPAALIRRAAADGVILALTPTGGVKAKGDAEAVNRWLPVLRERKPEIVAALAEAANDRQELSEVFQFAPPCDPANDDEALQERAAIMAEANGWDDAAALNEARWQADRERCWCAFLRNAARILAAPEAQREALLSRYREEASRRYGSATAADMTSTLRKWVEAEHRNERAH